MSPIDSAIMRPQVRAVFGMLPSFRHLYFRAFGRRIANFIRAMTKSGGNIFIEAETGTIVMFFIPEASMSFGLSVVEPANFLAPSQRAKANPTTSVRVIWFDSRRSVFYQTRGYQEWDRDEEGNLVKPRKAEGYLDVQCALRDGLAEHFRIGGDEVIELYKLIARLESFSW